MFIASDINTFRSLFCDKLNEMLSPTELGAYILVLANSLQDEDLHQSLVAILKDTEQSLRDAFNQEKLNATQDDKHVFEQLLDYDIEHLPRWHKHQVDDWAVMSNPFRRLRPMRSSNQKIENIHKAFESEAFNFNRDFLKPEILWQGKWQSENHKIFDFKVLYNKFPFIPYHLLIVPDAGLQSAQYLARHYHDMIWDLVFETDKQLPGFGAGYNSLGACASVNHLHFQSFILKNNLPIELSKWRHNGGDVSYPMSCLSFDDKQQAWQAIQSMHDNNAPYNLLYRPGCCYLIPRQFQGSACVNKAVVGAGWIEECGVFVAGNDYEAEQYTVDKIVENLNSLSM